MTIQTLLTPAADTTAELGHHQLDREPGRQHCASRGGDSFTVDNSLNTDNDIKTDWGVNGIDLNGDGNLDVALVERREARTSSGQARPASRRRRRADTINAGGSTITGAAFPTAITIDGAASLTTT